MAKTDTPSTYSSKERLDRYDRFVRWALVFLSGVAALGALLRLMLPNASKGIDEVTLLYLGVAGVLLLFRDVKSISWGDKKVELGQLREALERKERELAVANESVSSAIAHGIGGRAGRLSGPAAMSFTAPGAPIADPDDPQKGRWGGSSTRNGRKLSGRVTPLQGNKDWYAVRLEVRSIDPRNPLTGDVVFHLHPTFQNSENVVPVRDGIGTLSLVAWGAFTVGAVVDQGATTLELDLQDIEDAPDEFRIR